MDRMNDYSSFLSVAATVMVSVVDIETGGKVLISTPARATCSVKEGNPQPATISWWINDKENSDISGLIYDFTPPDAEATKIECRASNGLVASASVTVTAEGRSKTAIINTL